jgi:hypothetical protein
MADNRTQDLHDRGKIGLLIEGQLMVQCLTDNVLESRDPRGQIGHGIRLQGPPYRAVLDWCLRNVDISIVTEDESRAENLRTGLEPLSRGARVIV